MDNQLLLCSKITWFCKPSLNFACYSQNNPWLLQQEDYVQSTLWSWGAEGLKTRLSVNGFRSVPKAWDLSASIPCAINFVLNAMKGQPPKQQIMKQLKHQYLLQHMSSSTNGGITWAWRGKHPTFFLSNPPCWERRAKKLRTYSHYISVSFDIFNKTTCSLPQCKPCHVSSEPQPVFWYLWPRRGWW